MKKIICLFLITIFCLMSVSCTLSSETPFVSYTADDSVTDRDCDFLSKIQSSSKGDVQRQPGNEPAIGRIAELHESENNQQGKLFYIENDINNAYYLCLYASDGFITKCSVMLDRMFGTTLSTKYYEWYRFDNCSYEDIPRTLDGKELVDVYFLCNSLIKRDIVNSHEYNIEFTFYYQVGVNTNEITLGSEVIDALVDEKMLIYRSSTITEKHLDGLEYLFLTVYFKDWDSDKANDFCLYTDEHGETYLSFQVYEGSYSDGKAYEHDPELQQTLGNCYTDFLPHFKRLYEIESEGYPQYQCIGIILDLVEEIAFGLKFDER